MGDETLRVDLADASGASLVGWKQDAVGAIQTTVETRLGERIELMDFISPGDRALAMSGNLDCASALEGAIEAARGRDRAEIYIRSGRFRIDRKVQFALDGRQGISIIGEGLGLTQIIVNSASGDGIEVNYPTSGNWWLNATPSNVLRIANISFAATLKNQGVGVKLAGNALRGRVPAVTQFENVEWRGADSINDDAFLTGVELVKAGSVYFTNCRFIVGGTTNDVPTAVKASGTSLDEQPVNIWFSACDWTYGGTGVDLGDYIEGVYFTNCSGAEMKTMVDWTNASVESGFHWVGGHIATKGVSIDLANVYDWVLAGAVIFGSKDEPGLPVVRVAGAGRFVVSGNVIHARNSSSSVGVQVLSVGSSQPAGGVISGNTFSGFDTAIHLAASTSGVSAHGNNFASCSTRVNNGSSGNYIEPFDYVASPVVTLAGGAASELVSFPLPAGRFVTKAEAGYLQMASGGTQDLIGYYQYTNSTSTAAQFRVVRRDGGTIGTGMYRFSLLMVGLP